MLRPCLAFLCLVLILAGPAGAGPEAWKPPLVMLQDSGFARIEQAFGQPQTTSAWDQIEYRGGKSHKVPCVTWTYKGSMYSVVFRQERVWKIDVLYAPSSGLSTRPDFYFTRDTIFRIAASSPKASAIQIAFRRKTPEGHWIFGTAAASVPGGAFGAAVLGRDGLLKPEFAVDRFWGKGSIGYFRCEFSSSTRPPAFQPQGGSTVLTVTGDGIPVRD